MSEKGCMIQAPKTLPDGWRMVEFGDVVCNVNISEHNPMEKGLERFVGLEHMDPGSLQIKRWGMIEDGTTFTRKFVKGQVLFGKRRSYLGKLAVADFDGICSGDILVFETKDSTLIPELLPFIVQNDNFFDFAIGTSSGSLSPRTKWKHLASYEFPLPPKDEQRRIADILWAAEDCIVKNEKLVEMSEFFIKTLMAKLFTKGIVHSDFKDTEIGKIPITWEIGTISTIAEANPKTDVSQMNEDSPVTFLPMENISENGKILKRDTRKYFEVKKGFTCFAENDVLFAKITPCMENGKGALATYLTNKIGFGSTEYHILRAKENGSAEFILYLTRSQKFRKDAEKYMTGSAGQKRVSKDVFLQYKIPIPPLHEQRQIANILSKVDDTIQKAQENINKIKTLKMISINQFLKNGLENTYANPQQGKKIIYETQVS